MFGLPGFPKLLLIAAIIAVVWYFMRRAQVSRRDGNANIGRNGQPSRGNQTGAKNQKPIEDMIQCKACGAYVPAKTGCSCGKSAGR